MSRRCLRRSIASLAETARRTSNASSSRRRRPWSWSTQSREWLAHPLETEGTEEIVPQLALDGLDGIECYYQGYSAEQVEHLVGLAREHGLVPTGGSDYHGFPMAGMTEVTNEPGSVDIPPHVVDQLLERKRKLFG